MTASFNALFFTFIIQGLALVAWCCLAAALLSFFSATKNPLQPIVTPVLQVMKILTPDIIPVRLHLFLAILWLMLLRVIFYMWAGAHGLLPGAAA